MGLIRCKAWHGAITSDARLDPRDETRDRFFYCGTGRDKTIVPREKFHNNQNYCKSGISAL